MIAAAPYPFPDAGGVARVVIDMQRDFLEPGGFGEALGNDVSRLRQIVPTRAGLPAAGETVIAKPGKGAFYATGLDGLLKERGITRLVVTGVTTEVCVQTTMREANDRGYECLLVEDATESYFPEFKQATLAMVRAQDGIVGWTAPAHAVLDAISEATSDAVGAG